MLLLILAVLLFDLLHLAAVMPTWKSSLVRRFGQRGYGLAFGLSSLLALVLIIWGWHIAPFIEIYSPLPWAKHVTFTLVLIGFLCLGVFLFRGRLRQILRFPMAMAILFWGAGHLLVNGDLAALVLFGGLMAGAAAMLILGLGNALRPTAEVRAGHDALSLATGVALYVGMMLLHPMLIGVPVISLG